MSGKAIGHVFDLELPKNKKIILLAMADHADHEGRGIRPSIGLIAWKADYSEAQTRRIIKALVKDGILTITRQSGGRNPSEYAMDFKAGKLKQPYHLDDRVDYEQPLHIDARVEPAHIDDRVEIEPLHIDDKVNPVTQVTPKPIHKDKSIASQKSDAVAASEVTSRIAAWLNALTAVPIGNHYQNKTNRAHAVEMFNRGITPEQIGNFVKHLLSQPFWKGKTIKFHYVAENIPAWLETQKPIEGEKVPSQYTSPLDGLRFVS